MRPLAQLPGPVARPIAWGSRLLPGSAPGRLGGALRRARKLLAAAGEGESEQYVAYCLWATREERRSLLRPEVRPLVEDRDPEEETRALLRRHPGRSRLGARLYRDLKTFLPALNLTYTDKSTMMVGLEARVPYLDVDLVEFAAKVPDRMLLRGGTTKHILRKALAPRLPREVLRRGKTGFGVPLRKWVKHDLRELVGDLLDGPTVRRRGLFRPEAVEAVRRGVDRGTGDHAYLLWALATLELWQQTFTDPGAARPPEPPRGRPWEIRPGRPVPTGA
jgi:asparagine synthase (glutamine-hydrolysing)